VKAIGSPLEGMSFGMCRNEGGRERKSCSRLTPVLVSLGQGSSDPSLREMDAGPAKLSTPAGASSANGVLSGTSLKGAKLVELRSRVSAVDDLSGFDTSPAQELEQPMARLPKMLFGVSKVPSQTLQMAPGTRGRTARLRLCGFLEAGRRQALRSL
jgi:hypothetical protein